MDLNFPVFVTGVRIFRASNDVGPLFVGPGSTPILEITLIGQMPVEKRAFLASATLQCKLILDS